MRRLACLQAGYIESKEGDAVIIRARSACPARTQEPVYRKRCRRQQETVQMSAALRQDLQCRREPLLHLIALINAQRGHLSAALPSARQCASGKRDRFGQETHRIAGQGVQGQRRSGTHRGHDPLYERPDDSAING